LIYPPPPCFEFMNTSVSDDDSGVSEILGLRESSPESSKGSVTVRVESKSGVCACGKRASFGRPGTKRATHCARCKPLNYADVANRKCIVCLRIQPKFGKPGTRRATHCKACKLVDYVDVKNKRCVCGSRPSFGGKIGDMATRCGKCKLTGWIDVVTKKCSCGTKPVFAARVGDRPTRCATCLLPGWINVKNKKCSCGLRASFGEYYGDKPTRCSNCILPGWVDVIHKRCLTDGCDTRVTDNNIFCANCDPEPGRRRKIKERRVFEALCTNGLVPSKYDRAMADTSCGLSRPDFNYDRLDRAVLVECDEFQHNPSMSNYTPECELRRMIDLHAASGGLPTIIVRFNPDAFELDGVAQKIGRKSRHEALFTEIRRVMDMPSPPPGTLSVTYMFFDKVTCAGIPPTDRGILRRYSIDTYDPEFPLTREPG